MFTRDRLRSAFSVIGVIVLFLAVMPFFRYEVAITNPAVAAHVQANPGVMPYTEDYVFGWSNSPLVKYHRERVLTVEKDRVAMSQSANGTIGWFSWSSLSLIIGIGLLWLAQRLKPKPVASMNIH